MDEMRVREADLIKRIGDLELKNNTIEVNLYHVHEKINAIYELFNTLTADDWKAKGKWEEYKLMIKSLHHVLSKIKEETGRSSLHKG